MTDPVLVGVIVAVAIFLSRVGLAERRAVKELETRLYELEDELRSLRGDLDDVNGLLRPSRRDELYDPSVDYGARAERYRRRKDEGR